MAPNSGEGGGGNRQAARPAPTELPARFAGTVRRVEQALAADLDEWLADVPARLGEAIRYALLSPGKRLRPVLLLWSAELADPSGSAPGRIERLAMPAAVAVEMLHTYSLVHDDLPSMDDDELRRGQPTCHVAFGEGLAVLAGDALLTRAFEVIARSALPPERVAALVRALADGSGAAGMIGGQAEDLAHQHDVGDLPTVEYIHEHKTAALFAAACRMGAIAAGADGRAERALAGFGRCLGLAFQIVDDLLDETGQTEQLGKRAGKDRSAGKLTYPSVAGLDASRAAAARWMQQADAALVELPSPDGLLLEDIRAVARYVIERTR